MSRERTPKPAKVRKGRRFERFSPVDQVRQVKVGNVVADDDVRVGLLQELAPTQEQVLLLVKLKDLSADDVGAGLQRKDVPDEGFAFACHTSSPHQSFEN